MTASQVGGTAEVSDSTRDKILDVALELMSSAGFAATSTRELSERMGFTKAALYYHFRSKDDLLAALTGAALDRLRTITEGPFGTVAQRRAMLSAYVDLTAENRQLVQLISQDPAALRSPALAAVPELYDRLLRRLTGVTSPGLAELTRSRAALGAVNAGLQRSEPGDDLELVNRVVLDAGCAALGIPGLRTR
jgi:AcrR family transcriptional regulator